MLRIGTAGLLSVMMLASCASVADLSGPRSVQTAVMQPTKGTLYENVCHLTIHRFPGGTSDASAVLYRGRYLLTAGHNAYQDRSRITGIEVRCGAVDADLQPPDELVSGRQALDASGFDWLRFPDRHDFGVIRLTKPIATAKPISLASTPVGPGTRVRLSGYPGKTLSNARRLYQAEGVVEEVKDGTVSYAIDTHQANSGGPVWREGGDGAELVAIHIQPSRGRVVDADFTAEVDRLIATLDARAGR